MTLIRIYVRSNGAELDVREEETVSLQSEPETARLARMMRTVLGKVERALGFETRDGTPGITVHRVPADLLSKIQSVDLSALTITPEPAPAQVPELPAPTGRRPNGAPFWRVLSRAIPEYASVGIGDPDAEGNPRISIAVEPGDWSRDDARCIAHAILAATDWKEDNPDA
ncbi:hypothetical protein [Nocardia sp. NPDC005745]|uniref:hypothetical protein n=1 Tax=Nocardia sp. NPDC005745 TaxID=3157061 RepID=UPI0033F651F9